MRSRSSSLHVYLHGTQRLQLVQALFHSHLERDPGLAELSPHQVGHHHHEDMPARMLLGPHVHGPDFEVPSLARAECLLHLRHANGLHRFTLRGKTTVNAQWRFSCLVHNLFTVRRFGPGFA